MKHIEKLRVQLHDLSIGPQTEETKMESAALRAKLKKVYSDEDMFWRQRSKVTWAREGDRNTSFFHLAATARKQQNFIHGLYDSEGRWCQENHDVEKVITDYFDGLFQTSHPDPSLIDEVLEPVSSRIPPEVHD